MTVNVPVPWSCSTTVAPVRPTRARDVITASFLQRHNSTCRAASLASWSAPRPSCSRQDTPSFPLFCRFGSTIYQRDIVLRFDSLRQKTISSNSGAFTTDEVSDNRTVVGAILRGILTRSCTWTGMQTGQNDRSPTREEFLVNATHYMRTLTITADTPRVVPARIK